MRFEDLCDVQDGWAGGPQRSLAPSRDVLFKAKAIADALQDQWPTYPAEFVPIEDGTVQVEFHADGWDVEVWIGQAEQNTGKSPQ